MFVTDGVVATVLPSAQQRSRASDAQQNAHL